MRTTVVFLDASVLYPAPLRDLLLELAVSDLFRAKWSASVQDEWIRALLRNRPDLTAERLERTRRLMDAHVRDALVTGFEDLIGEIELPDPDDRHVLAAAAVARVDMILAANIRHFPEPILSAHGLEAQHPDVFLANLCDQSPTPFLDALHRVRARLRNPPVSREQHLDTLRRVGLNDTVDTVLAWSAPPPRA